MSTLVDFPAGKRLILGSRSSRRRELLELLVPGDQISVVPPQSREEQGFDDVTDWHGIETRLEEIARAKAEDVRDQLASRNLPNDLADVVGILTADTVVVVEQDGALKVLGQPPAENWKQTVRDWFAMYFAGKTHWVVTCVRLGVLRGGAREEIVKTAVTFSPEAEEFVESLIRTEEPLGKAGGYGLQAGGSLFVERVEGSPSNVIGLPLLETAKMLKHQIGE